jgi:hypothetical protein
MRNDPIFGASDQDNDTGLDYDRFTITLQGRELTVSEALVEDLLAHDEHTGLLRMGSGYSPHRPGHR